MTVFPSGYLGLKCYVSLSRIAQLVERRNTNPKVQSPGFARLRSLWKNALAVPSGEVK